MKIKNQNPIICKNNKKSKRSTDSLNLSDDNMATTASDIEMEDANVSLVESNLGVDTFSGDVICELDEDVNFEKEECVKTENISSNDIKKKFSELEDFMDVKLANLLREKFNIHSLFPIQEAVIPFILKDVKFGLRSIYSYPNDAYIWAPTGTGKTISFAVPLIIALRNVIRGKIRAIIILPTQNLAVQIGEIFTVLSEPYGLPVFVSGKSTLSKEIEDISNDVPLILISTPGRLIDYLSSLDLSFLRFIVFDEADKLLCDVKHDWISRLLSHVNRPISYSCQDVMTKILPLQKILASATLELLNISELKCWNPVLIAGNSEIVPLFSVSVSQVEANLPSTLTEGYIICKMQLKPLVLRHFLIRTSAFPSLIFVRSRETARRLACLMQLLEPMWHIAHFTADSSTKNRTRIIKNFNNGKINVLITSDVLARGMDLENVRLVFLYDPPSHFTTYVHRVGRTARAGKSGLAVTMLCSDEQLKTFKQLTIDRAISEFQVDSSDFDLTFYEQCLNQLPSMLSERSIKKMKRKKKIF